MIACCYMVINNIIIKIMLNVIYVSIKKINIHCERDWSYVGT